MRADADWLIADMRARGEYTPKAAARVWSAIAAETSAAIDEIHNRASFAYAGDCEPGPPVRGIWEL